MARIRSVLFWLHLAVGVIAGGVILIMALTGVALTYQKQMTSWADLRGLDGAPGAGFTAPMATPALLAAAATERKGTPTAVVWRNGPALPVEVQFGREGRLFVNAYTGAILGEGSVAMRGIFRWVTDWHRWLATSGENRPLGKRLTGAANLAFLLIVLSGMWLWWPRRATVQALRRVTWFRRGLSAKARDFNWHNVIGFWSAVPLAVVVASGVVISYGWAGDLVYRLVGELPPARSAPAATEANVGTPTAARAANRESRSEDVVIPAALDQQLAVARAAQRNWRTISLTLPKSDTAPSMFSVDHGMGGEPHKKTRLSVDAAGAVVSTQRFADQSTGRRARSILRFAHTGEVLGVVGQTIAGLISLGTAVLVLTGLALSGRRLRAWLARRRTPPPHAA